MLKHLNMSWSVFALFISSLRLSAYAAPTSDVAGSSPSETNTPSKDSPHGDLPNPFPSGIPIQPNGCDGENPSRECFNAMDRAGGYLYFARDSKCSSTAKSQLQTAVWDAHKLVWWAARVAAPEHRKDAGDFYMGPDWQTQRSRIFGNLQRVYEFQTPKTSEKVYITTSCKDTKNWCGERTEGKSVGGYAWTYKGWFGYEYHYITLCPIFFGIDSLDDKFREIKDKISRGDVDHARDMRYLRSTGQFFLHEMMHTTIASGPEPHIIDEYVHEIPKGERPGKNEKRAYGPKLVHKLAIRPKSQGGGVKRASTNADSYALLANALWWWGNTGWFPKIPSRARSSSSPSDAEDDDYPVFLSVDLGDADPSTANLTSLLEANLQSFGDEPSGSDDDGDGGNTPSKPDPPPKPTYPKGRDCHPFDGDYKKFSREKAYDALKTYCGQLTDDKVHLGFGSGQPNNYINQLPGDGIAEEGYVLNVAVSMNNDGCDDPNKQTDLDFGQLSVDQCTDFFMQPVDQCFAFTNPKSDKFWKTGGAVYKNCAKWVVDTVQDIGQT